MNRIARKVRRRRVTTQLSQAELARGVGRSQWWISAVERGEVRLDDETAKRVLAVIETMGRIKAAVLRTNPSPLDVLRLPTRIETANGFANRKTDRAGR